MYDTQPILRGKKHRRDRWMPGAGMQKFREIMERVMNIALQTLPGFLLCFAEVMGIPSGLHAAWMAALAVMGESLLWPAGGCLLAMMMRLIWGLPLNLEMVVTLGIMLVAPVVIFRRNALAMMGWTAIALLPTLLRGALAGTAAEGMLGLACVAVSSLSAPVMLRGIRALKGGKPLDSMEDRVAVGYTLGMLICGGGRMMLFGLNVGMLGCGWIALCMGLYLSVSAGALAGMVGGLILGLQGLPVTLSVALSVGGFLCGMVQVLGRRWLACLCFAMGCGLTMLLSGTAGQGNLAAVLAVSGTMLLLGRNQSEWAQRFFRRFQAAHPSAADAYAASTLASWERTVEAMARSVPVPEDDGEEHSAQWWKEQLCARCQDAEACPCMLEERARTAAENVWAQRRADGETWRLALENLRGLGCGRLYQLWQGMDELRSRDAANARQVHLACHQRDMLVTHLTAMAGAARRFAQLSAGENWWDDLSARQLRKKISELAVPATLVYAKRVQGHAQTAYELHRAVGAKEQAEELRLITQQTIDVPMEIASIEETRVLLCETPLLRIEAGMAESGVTGAGENGDAYWLGKLADGRYLAALSDGMGHGAAARKESAQTVRLLRLCLEAGYSRPQTLTAVNGMMLLAGRGERFATVDLLTVDLWTGQMSLDKLGAAASKLLRGRVMTDLTGDALPLGILEKVESRTCVKKLEEGDELVLMTDGVEDAFAEKASLDDAIRGAMSEATAQTCAQRLLASAAEVSSEGRRDDMTVIVLRVHKTD